MSSKSSCWNNICPGLSDYVNCRGKKAVTLTLSILMTAASYGHGKQQKLMLCSTIRLQVSVSQYSFCELDLLKGRIWESVSPTYTPTHIMPHSGWISMRKNFYRSSTFKRQGNSRTASPLNEIFQLGTRCTTGHLASRSTLLLWQGRVSNINSYWKWHRWSPSNHLHWRRHSTHFSWWRSNARILLLPPLSDFGSFFFLLSK